MYTWYIVVATFPGSPPLVLPKHHYAQDIKNQILELVNESLLVVVLEHTEADPSLIPEFLKLNRIAENTSFRCS